MMGSPEFYCSETRAVPAPEHGPGFRFRRRPRPMRVRIRGLSRGRRRFASEVLAAFGGVSAMVQFTGQLFPGALARPGLITAAALGLCVAWGVARARRRSFVAHEFRNPGTKVVVVPGDLFDQEAHLVVGFTDTFDTETGGDTDTGIGGLIDASSLQGQLLDREYAGDARFLDRELTAALHEARPQFRERRADKRRGKLLRYPIGTTVVLGRRPRLVFAVACSRIGNDYVARSSVEEFGVSLHRLWDAVQRHGRLEPLAMPLLGAGLSRLDHVDVEGLVRMIVLSFVLRSRERLICRELRIVLRTEDFARLDLRELDALLGVLEPTAARL